MFWLVSYIGLEVNICIVENIYNIMLFAGWEVRVVKNCDRGLENAVRGCRQRAAFSRLRSQFLTIRTDLSRWITYLFFSSLSNDFVYSQEKNSCKLTVTVVRDRKIRSALRTDQIAEFVIVTAWKKINTCNNNERHWKCGIPNWLLVQTTVYVHCLDNITFFEVKNDHRSKFKQLERRSLKKSGLQRD